MTVQDNGRMPIQEKLTHLLTEGYSCNMPLWTLWMADGQFLPQVWLYREIEMMLLHPVINNGLGYYKGAIAGADFEGPKGLDGQPRPISQNEPLAEYVYRMCRRWWDRGVPKAQNGYEYGWIGLENVYEQKEGGSEDGLWEWTGCVDFHPLNCFLLTQASKPVGVRINHIVGDGNQGITYRDLWINEPRVPSKALWYVHRPRYHRYYGQSQLLGAWKPWRRLAWKDAAETVIDAGFFRQGYGGPVIGYPEEDLQGPMGSANTTIDTSGALRRYARDEARQMAQWAKSGAGIGMPSTCYPSDMGGKPKWTFEWADTHFNGEPLLSYINYLIKMVREGIGVPNELIEAAETGSGYSGRAIPLEGFLQKQQEIANALLELFFQQVLRPLVYWNRNYFQQFGPLDFEVCVANLLETKLKAAMNPGGAEPGMRAGGGMEEGQDEGTEQQAAAGDGTQWSPFSNQNSGKQGWKSTGGLIRYQQQPPSTPQGGMSVSNAVMPKGVEHPITQNLARHILGLARKAA